LYTLLRRQEYCTHARAIVVQRRAKFNVKLIVGIFQIALIVIASTYKKQMAVICGWDERALTLVLSISEEMVDTRA
jgi:hypothetical protein